MMHSSTRPTFKTIALVSVLLCTRWWQQACGILVNHKLNRHNDQSPWTRPGSDHNAMPAQAARVVAMENKAREIDVKMSTGLRPRESYHFARKIFHFTTIMAFAAMYSTKFSRWNLAKGLALMDACVLASELARLRISSVNRLLFRIFGPFMRADELRKFSGIMYCLAGLGLTTALFPKHIALLGMMQLAIGDPIAALCGHATSSVRWSRLRSGKGLLGALGCAIVLTVANYFALINANFEGMPQPVERLVRAAALIAIWTAFIEVAVPSPQKTLPCDGFPIAFDDNIVLPVLGALGAAAIFRLLELPDCQLRPWVLA